MFFFQNPKKHDFYAFLICCTRFLEHCRDHLRTQCSETSMGKLYPFLKSRAGYTLGFATHKVAGHVDHDRYDQDHFHGDGEHCPQTQRALMQWTASLQKHVHILCRSSYLGPETRARKFEYTRTQNGTDRRTDTARGKRKSVLVLEQKERNVCWPRQHSLRGGLV